MNTKSYESIFDVKNEPSKMLVIALNKWAEILNYELPGNMRKIILHADMKEKWKRWCFRRRHYQQGSKNQ